MQAGHASAGWHSVLGAGVLYNREENDMQLFGICKCRLQLMEIILLFAIPLDGKYPQSYVTLLMFFLRFLSVNPTYIGEPFIISLLRTLVSSHS